MEENEVHIPNGWKIVSQLGSLGKVFNGLSGKTKDDFGSGEPYIPYVNVFKNSSVDITELDYVKIKAGEKQNVIEYGDIIFTTSSETIEEVGMTSVFFNKTGKYYLNSFCFIFRLNNNTWLIPEFSQYLFRTENVRHSISLLGQGSTRYNLSKTRLLKELNLLIPSNTKEQTQIATILSKVDEAITQTEQLIAKYTRIKTGLMQNLLTKGIDENGNVRSEETHEFKDSPLGRIPKEWDVKKMGDLILAIDPQPDHRTPMAVTDGVPYVGISDVLENGEIDIKSCRKVGFNVLEKQQRLFTVDSGDIIFGKIGTIGKPKVLPLFSKHPFTLSANIILIKPHECPDFVYWSLISSYVEDQVNLAIHSTSQPAFGMQKIRDLDILTPLPEERDRITSKLDKLNKVVQSEKNKLSKYQSLKTGLMQDLLSGKVRVNHLIKETVSV